MTHRVVPGAGHGARFPAAEEMPLVVALFDRTLAGRGRPPPKARPRADARSARAAR